VFGADAIFGGWGIYGDYISQDISGVGGIDFTAHIQVISARRRRIQQSIEDVEISKRGEYKVGVHAVQGGLEQLQGA
jgi:hypothetical protein